jgi:hypothetical protein
MPALKPITDDDVLEILVRADEDDFALAKEYGIAVSVIFQIKHGNILLSPAMMKCK